MVSKWHSGVVFAYVLIAIVLLAPEAAAATEFEDGTYAIEYKVLQADSDSVSIANDYFLKPATLTIKNGKQVVAITVKHSEWVKELKAAEGESFVNVHVASADQESDTRIVTFKADSDLSEPMLMQMHIRIESMQPVYDHQYTVRFDYDAASAIAIDPDPSFDPVFEESSSKSSMVTIYVIVALLVAVVAYFMLVRKFGNSKSK